MRNRQLSRNQAGVGKTGCVVWWVILIIVILFLVKFVPAKMHTAEFADKVQEEANFGSIKGNNSIHDELIFKANELGLPITKDQVKVSRTASDVTVEVHYQVAIDFYGIYTWVLKEDNVVTRPIFLT